MATKTTKTKTGLYNPEELKTLFEALNMAPSYLSKRFIMRNLCGWDEQMIADNAQFKNEEENMAKMGNKVGGYR